MDQDPNSPDEYTRRHQSSSRTSPIEVIAFGVMVMGTLWMLVGLIVTIIQRWVP